MWINQHKYLSVQTHIILNWKRCHLCIFPTHSTSPSLFPHPHHALPTLSLLRLLLSLNFTCYYPLFYLFLSSLASNTIFLPDIFSPQYTLDSAREEDSVLCVLFLPEEYNKAILPKTICYHRHSRLCWAGKESHIISAGLTHFTPFSTFCHQVKTSHNYSKAENKVYPL